MSIFRVALLQLVAENTQSHNMGKGAAYCRRAKEMGADIALFPEIWNTGYAIPEDEGAAAQAAVDRDSLFVGTFRTLAKELDMAIAITYPMSAT